MSNVSLRHRLVKHLDLSVTIDTHISHSSDYLLSLIPACQLAPVVSVLHNIAFDIGKSQILQSWHAVYSVSLTFSWDNKSHDPCLRTLYWGDNPIQCPLLTPKILLSPLCNSHCLYILQTPSIHLYSSSNSFIIIYDYLTLYHKSETALHAPGCHQPWQYCAHWQVHDGHGDNVLIMRVITWAYRNT